MRSVALASLVAIVLAGCASSSDGGGAPTSTTGTTSPGGLETVCVDDQMRPVEKNPNGSCKGVPTAIPVSFDGNLGTFAHTCVFPPTQPPQCETETVVAAKDTLLVESPGSNFTGMDINVTWTSQSAATAELSVSYFVWVPGDGDYFGNSQGTSPIHIKVRGENVALNETIHLAVWVYNPKGIVILPASAGYVVVSVDQDFKIEGTVTVEAPAKEISAVSETA